LGGAQPAEASAPVCFDPSGFQYRGFSCVPQEYNTDCAKGGCYREGLESHPINCPSNGRVYLERHRTCGEDVTYNGIHKQFALRLNVCGGDYDGWEWLSTDAGNCSCTPQAIRWSCNDGYVRIPNGSGGWTQYLPTICMTDKCMN
jgi:hypothetical protein